MPGTNLVVVEHVLRAARAVRRVRPRLGGYVLIGLAISGWMGFVVLAGLLLAARPATAPVSEYGPEAPKAEVAQKRATEIRVEPEPAPLRLAPAPQPVAILTTYEERRRVQEYVRQADAADHEDGNVPAARSVYEYAATKGWAPAALALAFTYDPHELRRRGVTVAAEAATARGCYIKARELMNATVAFYLSRLPPGGEERC